MMQEFKKPSIIINNLLAKKDDREVYFQQFHNGINVLYGANGGGKTSIIQLLVYVLGYDVTQWVEEVLECDVVYAEVELNGQVLTFRRIIKDKAQQPLFISYDNLKNSLDKTIDSWLEFPYKISRTKESFSQRIFNILDIPENRVDDNVNMTLHQILRFIYKKQSDSAKYILNHEEWDSALKREAIQDYLLGFYDNELYDARINLKSYQKDLERIDTEIKSIKTILVNSDIDVQNISFDEFINNVKTEKKEILVKIEEVQKNEIANYELQNKDISELSNQNIKLKKEVKDLREKISNMHIEIEDNNMFIKELEDKINSINDSIKLKKLASSLIEFDICPSCFSKVTTTNNDSCSLCHTENPSQAIETNLLKMKNELEIQLNESNIINTNKIQSVKKMKETLKGNELLLENNTNKLNVLLNSIDITKEKKLYELFNKIGANEEKIETFKKLEKLSEKINEITLERNRIQGLISNCEDTIDSRESIIQTRKDKVSHSIKKYMKLLLKEDIAEKDDFSNITDIQFDLSMNDISINSKKVFSESSMFLINNMLHFAIFLSSFEHEFMRVPKLLILDGIENGGMSEERSKNFQNIIKKHTEKLKSQYQIFITTRSISEELNSPAYMLGDKLTETNKSLKL
ncbi:AAA family ATPase [Aliarcobacter butzleri]|uniref:AAA family ATPase n=1 Tax=Aliarcobacter butzleri TaxID=28197 RepID=UPI003B2223BB